MASRQRLGSLSLNQMTLLPPTDKSIKQKPLKKRGRKGSLRKTSSTERVKHRSLLPSRTESESTPAPQERPKDAHSPAFSDISWDFSEVVEQAHQKESTKKIQSGDQGTVDMASRQRLGSLSLNQTNLPPSTDKSLKQNPPKKRGRKGSLRKTSSTERVKQRPLLPSQTESDSTPAQPELRVDSPGPAFSDLSWEEVESSEQLYAKESINHMQGREFMFKVSPGFLDNNPMITPRMRATLMDWLVQVQDWFSLDPEVFHLSGVLVDAFLANKEISVDNLQLYGVTCLFIASKFYQRSVPYVEDLLRLTDDTYDREDLLAAEIQLLQTFNFDINAPIAITYLELYSVVLGIREDDQVIRLSKYCLDASVISSRCSVFTPSVRAAAALCLSLHVKRAGLGAGRVHLWTRAHHECTGYSRSEITSCMARLALVLMKAEKSSLQGVRRMYWENSRSEGYELDLLCRGQILKDIAKKINANDTHQS